MNTRCSRLHSARRFLLGGALSLYSAFGLHASGYTEWISGYPELSVEASAPTADPDGDGLANLLEYSLGGNPTRSNTSLRPSTILDHADSTLGLSFFRARPEITYTIQGSSDLQTWATVAINPGSVGKTATFTEPLSNVPRFLRLKVTGHSEAITAGLAAWRKPDANGLRCADCHTPSGYDIALFNFTLADVRLAGFFHLSEPENDAIYAMLEQLRAEHPPKGGLKDFRTFRPLQPGGEVVGGAESSAQVRDATFGELLKPMLSMTRQRITTLKQARIAAQELVDLDVPSIPVGIKMNLWSRSVHREGAKEGGEIAEWLPGIGIQPKPEFADQWFVLQDAYIADPSDANLWAIIDRIEAWTQPDSHNFTDGVTAPLWFTLSKNQFVSNLLFQHDLLQRSRGEAALFDSEQGVRPFVQRVRDWKKDQPELAYLWHVGDNARGVSKSFDALPVRHQESVYMDPELKPGDRLPPQISDLQLPWMYLGWMVDNSLLHSGDGSTRSGEYFIGALWAGLREERVNGNPTGYRMHNVFMNAVHQYKRDFAPDRGRVQGTPVHFTLSKAYYLGYGKWKKGHTVAGHPNALADYHLFITNHLRMNLLIAADEVKRLGVAPFKNENQRADAFEEVDVYTEVFTWADPDHAAQNAALVSAYREAMLAAPFLQ